MNNKNISMNKKSNVLKGERGIEISGGQICLKFLLSRIYQDMKKLYLWWPRDHNEILSDFYSLDKILKFPDFVQLILSISRFLKVG